MDSWSDTHGKEKEVSQEESQPIRQPAQLVRAFPMDDGEPLLFN